MTATWEELERAYDENPCKDCGHMNQLHILSIDSITGVKRYPCHFIACRCPDFKLSSSLLDQTYERVLSER